MGRIHAVIRRGWETPRGLDGYGGDQIDRSLPPVKVQIRPLGWSMDFSGTRDPAIYYSPCRPMVYYDEDGKQWPAPTYLEWASGLASRLLKGLRLGFR
jgi:hypothetical protein